jgi:hypothetical protein
MKKIKVISMFAILLTFAFSTLQAFPSELLNNPEGIELRKELSQKIKALDYKKGISEDVLINFLVNSENELVIISTNTNETASKIKNSINYSKIKSKDFTPNKLYTIKVRFEFK